MHGTLFLAFSFLDLDKNLSFTFPLIFNLHIVLVRHIKSNCAHRRTMQIINFGGQHSMGVSSFIFIYTVHIYKMSHAI